MKICSITLTLLLVLTITYGCSKKKKAEPFNVPGVKTDISRVLISPLAFDGATVAIIGYVKDFSISEEPNQSNVLLLSDKLDNTIIIEFLDNFQTTLGEQILVSGKFIKETNRIVEAKLYKIVIEDNTIRPLNN
ncbi:MAG: hypothetical protein GTO02_17130 [Candidatus Dadabacteria bacterium]|nr:hypothetical protein [Candidatus Dadabacteria bacterium]NIQ16049.1 hypothetical protein [Candidatus Dadabacteria bacterium]